MNLTKSEAYDLLLRVAAKGNAKALETYRKDDGTKIGAAVTPPPMSNWSKPSHQARALRRSTIGEYLAYLHECLLHDSAGKLQRFLRWTHVNKPVDYRGYMRLFLGAAELDDANYIDDINKAINAVESRDYPNIADKIAGSITLVSLALEEDAGEETAEPATAVAPSGALPGYDECPLSWGELAQVAQRISAAPTLQEARAVAQRAGLVDVNDRLRLLYKPLVLTDGRVVRVRIVGIAHDEKPDGTRAGITFGFCSPIDERSMNADRSNEGGWEQAGLRHLLDRDYFKLLPDEVASNVAEVLKYTNNVGETTKVSCVTATVDRLWLFTRVELAGEWNARAVWTKSPEAPLYDLIADAEGHQYELFAQLGVDDPYGRVDALHQQPIIIYDDAENTCEYWVRAPDPDNSSQFGVVLGNGLIANGFGATGRYAVVPAFCF